MLADLKISRKLSLLLILPMAAFFYIVTTECTHRWHAISENKFVEHSLVVSLSAGELIHEIQKERGYTAGYLGSKGAKYTSELSEQIRKTNFASNNFTTVLSKMSTGDDSLLKKVFAPFTAKVSELNNVRNAAKENRIDVFQAISTYNSCVTSLLTSIAELNDHAGIFFTSLLQLLHGKEVAGQERATLNAAFSAGTFSKQLYRDWLYRVSAQNTYLKSFAELGGKQAQSIFQLKMKSADDDVNRFRDTAYANLEKSNLDADSHQWFAASTRRIDKLMEVENAWGDHLLALARDEVNSAQKSVLIACVGAILVACISITLGWRLSITIGRPVRRTLRYAQSITKGDFDAELVVSQRDELGCLAGELQIMVSRLKEHIQTAQKQFAIAEERGQVAEHCRITAERAEQHARSRADTLVLAVKKIHDVVETATCALGNLSEQIRISADGAQAQAERLEDTTAAMQQMSVTVVEVAKNAADAAQTAENSLAQATGGSSVVDGVVSAIMQVQTQSDEMKKDMGLLGQQAEGIGQILNVISDIADQTNLLALNAAIEAARAGDAGRGFAVVADEVRKLAEKTMSATKEVGDAIQGIQSGTRKHISHVEQTAGTIEHATTLARQSGKSLLELVNLSSETSEQVQSIATASEEQSVASETIQERLEDINQISIATANAMDMAVVALKELRTQTDILVGVMADLSADGSVNVVSSNV